MKYQKLVSAISASICGLTMLMTHGALAQCSFTSGSTGADGAFTPTNSMPGTGWSISNNVVTVTNSSSGIFNFTSVYIETNWVVKFTRNTLNTPVFLLATTNVAIKGTINLDGANGTSSYGAGAGGPGGFDGGVGSGSDSTVGWGHGPGFGYGGGPCGGGQPGGFARQATSCSCLPFQCSSAPYGTLDILPFIGGSGGGGSGLGGAGGGAGAILIASSKDISVTGSITANGGVRGGGATGDGSGGAIRLIANTISGEGLIRAVNGDTRNSEGRIRIEACTNLRSGLTDPPATFGPPGVVFLSPKPTIHVTSIGGSNTPWPPAGSLTVPDVYLPTNFVNPAVISVLASNVNPGTTFKVMLIPAYGTNIVTTNSLSGTYAASTGSVNMNVYTDRVWRVNAHIDYIPRP